MPFWFRILYELTIKVSMQYIFFFFFWLTVFFKKSLIFYFARWKYLNLMTILGDAENSWLLLIELSMGDFEVFLSDSSEI